MLQRKMLMSIASVLVLVALIAGATMAWFTDSETVAATFTAGTVDVGINEPTDIEIVNPGDIINFGAEEDAGYIYDSEEVQGSYDRVLQITYDGSKAAYVRVLVDAAWAEDLSSENLSLEGVEGSPWVLQDEMVDGKYVFLLDGILNGSGEDFGDYDLAEVQNVPFIVTIDGAGTGNDYQGVALDMEFEVQAVQAANVDPNAVPFETVVPET